MKLRTLEKRSDAGSPVRHLLRATLVSPDRADFTPIGMNRSESGISLTVSLNGLDTKAGSKKIQSYRASSTRKCQKVAETTVSDQKFTWTIGPRSIFTPMSLK